LFTKKRKSVFMKRKTVFVIGSFLLCGVVALTLALQPQRPTTPTQAAPPVPAPQIAPLPQNVVASDTDIERIRARVKQLQRGNRTKEKQNKRRVAEAIAKAEASKQTLGGEIDRSSIPAPLKGVTKGLVNRQVDQGIERLTTPTCPTVEEMEKMSADELKEVLKQQKQMLAQRKREDAQAQAVYDAANAVRQTVGGITGK